MNARYQNPTQGQFISQDPMFTGNPNNQNLFDPQSLNSYNYANGNPITKSDPSGKFVLQYNLWLANAFISSTPNIPNSVREASFASQYPVQAYGIGSAVDGSTKNISSVASNFAVNLTSFGYGGNLSREGGERNAIRHVVWQAMIANTYGQDTAVQAGNSHEYNPFTNLSARNFSSLSSADQTTDLLNNQIGRDIAKNNPGASANQLAQKTLDYYYDKGLYTVQGGKDNTYTVVQSKISANQYISSTNTLDGLNNKGKTQ